MTWHRGVRALRRVPLWVQTLGAVIAFGAVATWLTVTTWDLISPSRLDAGVLTDFRDAIYYPVVAVRDGVNPYAVTSYYQHYPVGQEFPLYTPVHLLLHSPLLLFSFSTARAVYFGWNLALILGLAAAALRLAGFRCRTASVFGLGTLILLSDPGRFDLRTGQPTLMIVIGTYFVLRAVERRAPDAPRPMIPSSATPFLLGALSLAVVWSKPTYAIPLCVLLIARGRARVVAAGTAIGLALSAIVLPLLVDNAGGVGKLVKSWEDSARITSQSSQSRLGSGLRIDAANAFVRITRLRPSENIAAVCGLLVLLAGAWVVWKLHRRDPDGDREELAITLACLFILTSVYHVPYDYLLLVGPALMLARPRPTHRIEWPSRVRAVVLTLILIPLADPLGWSPVNAAVGKSGFEWLLGPTMMSVYVMTALGLCLWTALRHTRRSAQVAGVVEAEEARDAVGNADS